MQILYFNRVKISLPIFPYLPNFPVFPWSFLIFSIFCRFFPRFSHFLPIFVVFPDFFFLIFPMFNFLKNQDFFGPKNWQPRKIVIFSTMILGKEYRPTNYPKNYDKRHKEALMLLILSVAVTLVPEVRNSIVAPILWTNLQNKYQAS